jgi:cytoskeletal protein RodZ
MTSLAADAWCVESIRKAKGISLEEISNATKLKLTTLQAIEIVNFDAPPGGIYNISYIRQYARAIGAGEAGLGSVLPSQVLISGIKRSLVSARISTGTQKEKICQPLRQVLQTRSLRRAQ